jgi:hypothetical protein
LPPGEYLLYEPTASARELLGRQVVFDPQGAFRVADEKAHGCRVEVFDSADEWQREFAVERNHIVSGGINVLGLVELGGRDSGSVYCAMTIHNTRVLGARLKGRCGERVITRVKVGSGLRKVYRARSSSASAKVDLPRTQIGAALEGQDFEKLNLDLSWETEQAWSFELGGTQQEDGVRLDVTIDPTSVIEGEPYKIRVRSDEVATLVLIVEEDTASSGRSNIILPALAHGAIQNVTLEPNRWLELPPAIASLRVKGVEQRDRLRAYALRHEEDLDALELEFGELSDDVRSAQAERVMRYLDTLPPQTVGRRDIGYRILPRR